MQRYKIVVGTAALLGGLVLAACANDTDAGNQQPPADAPGTTVAAMSVGGDARLVDSAGRTLYFAEAEVGGTIYCVDECARFWLPLIVPAGATPTKDASLPGTLTVVTRPDGASQVMYDGKPLYTFVQDAAAGQATGDGFTDQFNGTTFVWRVATATGAAPAPTTSTQPGPTETQPTVPGYDY